VALRRALAVAVRLLSEVGKKQFKIQNSRFKIFSSPLCGSISLTVLSLSKEGEDLGERIRNSKFSAFGGKEQNSKSQLKVQNDSRPLGLGGEDETKFIYFSVFDSWYIFHF